MIKDDEIKNLLKLRIKCIALYPLSPYNIGDYIEISENSTNARVITSGYSQYWIPVTEIIKMRAVFEPVDWWRDRELGILTKYIKFINDDDKKIDFIIKVEQYINWKNEDKIWAFEYLCKDEPGIKKMAIAGWLPATEAEYLAEQNKKL